MPSRLAEDHLIECLLATEEQAVRALAEAVTYRWLFLTLFAEWGRQLDRANSLERQVQQLLAYEPPA